MQPFCVLPARKRHKKERQRPQQIRKRCWTKTFQHDLHVATETTTTQPVDAKYPADRQFNMTTLVNNSEILD